MKKSKILILLFTLSFPVILYLFLRSYGENEFALPVFFEKEKRAFCSDSSKNANSVQLFNLNQEDSMTLEDAYSADFKVVHFPNSKDSEIQTLKNELNRVLNTFNDLSLNIISLEGISIKNGDSSTYHEFLSKNKAKTFLYREFEKENLVNCIYVFPTEQWEGQHPSDETIPIESTLVLLDKENKLRGYYNGYETKEVDRLILEIRVLLSNE